MRRKFTAQRLPQGHAPTPRLAWWVAFLTTIALIAILNVVRADAANLPSAQAVPPSLAGFVGEVDEEELLQEELEEEELFGEEAECGEEEECLEELEEEWPPRECLLSSTDVLVTAYPHGRKVRLTVRYSARTSTQVAISYWLRGPKGALKMDTDRRRIAGAGSFHETEFLTTAQMPRALAAKSFMIEIRPLSAPRYCHVYFDHRLVVKRSTAQGPVWLDDETSFRVPSRH